MRDGDESNAATMPPVLPLRVGYDRWRVVRSALALLALAVAAGLLVTAIQRLRPTLLGVLAWQMVGPLPLLFALVVGVALLVVLVAVVSAIRQRDFLVLNAEGIEFHNSYGRFLVEWANTERIEVTGARYVGIRVRDQARLLATHHGSTSQRQLLATIVPHHGYDLILQPEQLSCGVERFVTWANGLRDRATEGAPAGSEGRG